MIDHSECRPRTGPCRYLNPDLVTVGMTLASGFHVASIRLSARKMYVTECNGHEWKSWLRQIALPADPPGYHDCMPHGC